MTVSVEEKTKHWLSERLPKSMVFSVLFVCLLPWVLILAGVDFGSHDALSGAFIHTILEWSAFCVAVMTVVLAFVHYQMMKDIAIPIICVALFFSGMMDAFSVLAADRLIFNADNPELISTIWSTGRIFNAFIMTFSVFFVMHRGWRHQRLSEQTLVLLLVAAAVTAFALTYYVYSLGVAFNVVDDGGFIVHPYDATALVLYLVCLTFLYPWLYKIHRSSFTYALILMAFVQIMAESYMVFGSDTVFDGYFNIAQFIKIIAYIVPFVALVLDYVGIHKSEKLHRLFISQQAYVLEESNRELDEFAYIASHDLREPLRGVQSYAQFLQEDYDDKLDDEGRKMLASLVRLGERMQMLIDDLLTYSRVGRVALATQKCDLNKVVESVLELLSARLKMDNIEIRFDHDLPTVVCDKTRIHEVFMNFISNSIKYNDKTQRWIEIGCRKMKLEDENIGMREVTALYISDNGIGIPEKHQEKIFGIFKRLHAKDKFGGGTGSGLTIAKKIIERHNGRVWVSSKEDEGSTFYFILGEASIDR